MTSPDAERRDVVRQGLTVGVATGLYGASFGAVSVTSGMSVAQTCALSLLVFTGATQFAFIGVLASGGSPISGAAAGLLLGTRNTLYGLGLAPLLRLQGWRRAGAAHLVIDESTAVAMGAGPTHARTGFFVTGLSIFALWNVMTFVGAVTGAAIGDPRTYGFDAAVGAAFLALLWPRLQDRRAIGIAAGAAVLALLLVPATPAGLPVILAASVALLAAVFPAADRGEQAS